MGEELDAFRETENKSRKTQSRSLSLCEIKLFSETCTLPTYMWYMCAMPKNKNRKHNIKIIRLHEPFRSPTYYARRSKLKNERAIAIASSFGFLFKKKKQYFTVYYP
jgi:hypothetical protein